MEARVPPLRFPGDRGDQKTTVLLSLALALARAARDFAPGGLDAALVLVQRESLAHALGTMRNGGRIAHPNGVEPALTVPAGVTLHAYDGEPSPDAFERLNRLIATGPFHVEVGRVVRAR